MSETQLEINGVTYSGKDLDLICLGMSLKEERIIKLLEAWWETNDELWQVIALIKGEK